ncbi:Uncharacterized transporter [Saitozyma sp. JCM 24511]|nr:Uncharacterized transporter [Saitozyma sp. JCM 24511]
MSPLQESSLEEKGQPSLSNVAIDTVETTLSAEEDARIRRKIDWNLLPLLSLIYGLQFLDKTCMSYAVVMGFRTDTHITLDQYAWLGSIFYLGYLVGEYPLSFALQKLPMAKMTGFNIIVWGVVLSLISVAQSFSHLMALRFFLGFFESSITPALSLFTAQYYKTREQGSRTAIWFSCNMSGAIIGSSMAYGLYQADLRHALPLAGWKLVFVILGSITAGVGVLFLVLVPDTVDKARFLTPDERVLAIERIRANQQGVIVSQFKPEQVKEALLDPLTWLYASVALIASIPNGGVTNFFSILIQGFGFTTAQTLLLGMTTAYIAFALIGLLWLGDKLKIRALITVIPTTISLVGTVLVWALPSSVKIGRLVGFYLISLFVISFVVTLSLITSNVAGQTKKTTVNAIYLVAYCIGNLIGPQTFRTVDAPRYVPALATIVACDIVLLGLMTTIHLLYRRENKRRDTAVTQDEMPVGHEFDDMTDRTNPAFRYTL